MNPILEFKDEYRWLSNFWPSKVTIGSGEGHMELPTVEHAYQASKTLSMEEREQFYDINAATAKRLGRKVTLRADWDDVKLGIMEDLVRQKFHGSTELYVKLMATYPRPIVEGNEWGDRFWGVCRGIGRNHLGLIITAIRDEIIEEEATIAAAESGADRELDFDPESWLEHYQAELTAKNLA